METVDSAARERRARAARILELAEALGALKYGDFTLSSGQKSRYYFDDRLLSLHPEGIQEITAAFLPGILESRAGSVGGPTVAADPIVGALTLLSAQRGRPLSGFLVRAEAKSHGTGQRVEGPLQSGTDVAVVDGTLSTGGSVFGAIEAAEAMGCRVVRVLVILDRRQGGSARLRERGYQLIALLEASPGGDVRVAE